MHNRIPKPSRNGHAVGCNGQPAKTPPKPVSDGAENAEAIPNAGRAENGRFATGNKCGLGNPFARKLGAFRSAFLNAISDNDIAAVARKLAELATAGDVQAAALFLSYAVGKPHPAVNPDRLDLDEFSIVDAAPTRSRVTAVTLDIVDPATAAEVARLVASSRVGSALLGKADKVILDEQDARIGKPATS